MKKAKQKREGNIRMPLRLKFYLLMIPSVVILLVLIVLLILPYGYVRYQVVQVNQGLAEIMGSQGFSRQYERQLRECTAFAATGNPQHLEPYDEARRRASADLKVWLAAEKAHTGDEPIEHAEEIKELEELEEYYERADAACAEAIALAGSGANQPAVLQLDEKTGGEAGEEFTKNLAEFAEEEDEQLDEYLNELEGALNGQPLYRVVGLPDNAVSMSDHFADATLTSRFATDYNIQVKELYNYIATGDPVALAESRRAQESAKDALDRWGEQAAGFEDAKDRVRSTRTVGRIRVLYAGVNAAQSRAVALKAAGDTSAALVVLETEAEASARASLTEKVDAELAAQKKALAVDVEMISTGSRNTAWGVGVIGTVLVLMAIGGTFLVSRMVVVPVVDLQKAARRFGEGDPDYRVDIKSWDELGELALAFNDMAAQRVAIEDELRDARDNLELRVEERTHELADTNEELRAQIEERERAEEELRRAEERFRELAETLPQVVFEIDTQGILTYVNQVAFDLFGYAPEDLEKGYPALSMIDESDHERVAGAMLKMMDGRSTGAVRQYLAKRRDGSTFPTIAYTTLITDNEGNPAGIRGILVDISEREAMEKAMRDEQEFTEMVLDSLKDVFYVLSVDKGGLLVRWNRACNEASGYTDEELAEMTVFDFVEPEEKEAQERFLQALAEKGTGEIDVDVVTKDGGRTPYSFSSTLVKDESGNPLYVSGVGRDVTERKEAEERLRLAQFEIDKSYDLIVRVGSDSRIVYANDAACEAHGYNADEMLSLTLPEVNLNFPAENWGEIWPVMREGGSYHFESTSVRKDGSTFPVEAAFNFMVFEGSEFIVVFGRDITERREAEERQRMLTEELVGINKELNDFAYVISHDLKAPLRGIGSLASWLSTDYGDRLDEDGRRQLDLLLDRAKRMEALIESVLQYSRVGRIRESREKVDLDRVVAGAVEMVGPPPGIEVGVEGPLPVVVFEKTRISQVFANLISNAVKFMDREDGIVTVSSADWGDRWMFSVKDNGPGIDEKHHERIFQIFQTLSSRDDRESTGVGLTLVKRIVEMNGGRIWLESEPGKGSNFCFTVLKTGPEARDEGG